MSPTITGQGSLPCKADLLRRGTVHRANPLLHLYATRNTLFYLPQTELSTGTTLILRMAGFFYLQPKQCYTLTATLPVSSVY